MLAAGKNNANLQPEFAKLVRGYLLEHIWYLF